MRAQRKMQVGAATRGIDIGPRCAGAHTAPDRDIDRPEALALGAVGVIVAGITGLPAGLDEGTREGMLGTRSRDLDRSGVPVVGVIRAMERLGAPEIRQHLGIGPTGVARRGNAVVIARESAVVDHAVDRTAAAHHLAARKVENPVVQLFLRRRDIGPRVCTGQHDGQQPAGRTDQRAAVALAGLDQQHLHRGVLAEPRGEHATGRAATDDDVVVNRLTHRAQPHCTNSIISGSPARSR